MINWEELTSFDDWSNALTSILDNAKESLFEEDHKKQIAVQKELISFCQNSPNSICLKLDEIARQAVKDIAAESFKKGIQALADRTVELTEYIKIIKNVTVETKSTTNWLLLESPIKIIESLSQVVNSFSQLKGKYQDNDEISVKVSDIVEAITELKGIIGRIV